MGLASLWIILYHSDIAFTQTDGGGIAHFFYILDYNIYLIKSLGQTGVDIFLFLSAVGLFFSLSKDEDLLSFYKKRIGRIIPTYLLLGFIYELLTFASLKESLFSLLGINFILFGKRRYWYVFLALFTYAVYPFLYKLEKKKGRWIYFVFIGLSILCNGLLSFFFPALFNNIEIALRRLPIFLLGCYFAKEIKDRKEYSAFLLVFIVFGLFLSFKYLVSQEYTITTIYRYVNGIYAFTIIILLSYFYDFLHNSVILNKITSLIEKCGNYTLEYYIGFDIALLIVKTVTQKEKTAGVAFLSFIVCAVFSYIIKNYIIDKLLLERKTS